MGYLTGISHVDPLRWGLTLERFISEDTTLMPDIDLDFPRQFRDELIRRVHQRFGPEFAVLAGAVSTYSVKSIIQDLGKALGLPREELSLLSKQLHSSDADALEAEMWELPAFRDRVDIPDWRGLLEGHWRRFLDGAQRRGVPEDAARRVFAKLNGQYMFPESHSHAFAVTAYQAAWLKRYHPVEFFVSLVNNQPMGFYPVQTLKQDARRFGVPFLNPCVNRSMERCIPENGAVLLGLRFIRDVGEASAKLIVAERRRAGPYFGAGGLVRRTGLKPQAALSLVRAGAFDGVTPNRRAALWDAGLAVRPGRNGQAALPLPLEGNAPELPDFTAYERMAGEYEVMGIYPQGHLMEFIRPRLGREVLPATAVYDLDEGAAALVAGWPIARQHPKGREGTVFVTIEDEEGDVQLILRPGSSGATAGSCRATSSWPAAWSPAATEPPPWLFQDSAP